MHMHNPSLGLKRSRKVHLGPPIAPCGGHVVSETLASTLPFTRKNPQDGKKANRNLLSRLAFWKKKGVRESAGIKPAWSSGCKSRTGKV
jgi:hypothetical protein